MRDARVCEPVSLKYEPASEPLHISEKWLFFMEREGFRHLRRGHRDIVDLDGVDEALVRRDVELSRPE